MKKLLLSLLSVSTIATLSAQSLQGDMESWHTISAGIPPTQVEAPDNWFGVDSLVFTVGPIVGGANFKAQLKKDSDAHSGSYAAKVMTIDQGTQLGTIPGVLANAKINIDILSFDPNNPAASLSYDGGTAINQRYNYLSSWVKFFPKGIDKAHIIVNMVLAGQGAGGTDSIVGQGDTILAQQLSTYTNIEVPITYNDPNVVPDKMLLIFLSSTSVTASGPTDSSTLYVDDVEARQHPTGVGKQLFTSEEFNLYPNPANNKLNISTNIDELVVWQAYNVAGQRVILKTFTKELSMDVSGLANGVYYYTVSNEEGEMKKAGKFTIAR